MLVLHLDSAGQQARKAGRVSRFLSQGTFLLLQETSVFLFFFYPDPRAFLFSLLLEREEGRERNIDAREKHQLVASYMHPDGDCTCLDQISNLQPGMCPGWESSPQPLGYRMVLQPTEPHWIERETSVFALKVFDPLDEAHSHCER